MAVSKINNKMYKKVLKSFASIYALIFYRRKLKKKSCDILLLPDWPGGIKRAKKLITELEYNNFHVLCDVIPPPQKILLNRLFIKTERVAPSSYRFFEYYAAYIVRKYQPRILLTFMDSSGFSIFLKNEMEKIGGQVINIAHGVTGDSELFTMFNFHYYFVFGQSSVDAIFRQKTRYGNTKLVKVGSFLIDKEFNLPVNRESKKLLFLPSWLRRSVRDVSLKNFNLLARWARLQKNYQLVIKHHPLEDESIIRSIFNNIPNVKFLPKEINMQGALENISLVLTCWSVASLEAAVLNRPVVIINDSDLPDFLELENYYLPRARTVEEIQNRIEDTFARYDEFLKRSKDFVRRHLEHTTDSIPFMVNCIKSIYQEKEDFKYIPIEGTKNYFLHNR